MTDELTNEQIEILRKEFKERCQEVGVFLSLHFLKNHNAPFSLAYQLLEEEGSNPKRTSGVMNASPEILLFNDEKGSLLSVVWDTTMLDIPTPMLW